MNAITLYRLAHWCYCRRVPLLPILIRDLIFLLFNSYIPPSARIGRGTVFAYGAIGVVLHADCVIGEGCVIGQGVTVGAAEGFFSSRPNKCPVIGDNCYISVGARVLGDIVIGSHSVVGAGAVVVKTYPQHSILAGVPARVIGNTAADYLAIRP